MDHGENGAVLPRRLAKVISRETCKHSLDRHVRRWKGTEETPFRVAEANMKRVEVVITKKRRVQK